MNFFTPQNIAAVLHGRWLQEPPSSAPCTGVGIDTRVDLAGGAFFAIAGERHDGHDYLQQAVNAGAALLIVHRSPERLPPGAGVLLVQNTRSALAELARAYRATLTDTSVIAITGSAGKTTTKSLINAVLASRFTGTCAPRSFNNDIGVPLTILNASPSDDYLLLEIGTNAPGEIDYLASIAQPNIAVITMIGRSHLAGLGSVAAVAQEKASLLNRLKPPGTAIINADAPELYEHRPESCVTFGVRDGANLQLTQRGASDNAWWFEINSDARFALGLPGRHNAMNALAAVAVGRAMGMADDTISDALASVAASDMRFAPMQWRGMSIYNDAYNANPDSMIAAIDTFAELTADAPRRVLILGDMLELGDRAIALHEEVGRHLGAVHRRCPMHRIILIGPLAAHIGRPLAENITLVPTLTDSAIEQIHSMLQSGDAVLLKASRSVALERILTTDGDAANPSCLHASVPSCLRAFQKLPEPCFTTSCK